MIFGCLLGLLSLSSKSDEIFICFDRIEGAIEVKVIDQQNDLTFRHFYNQSEATYYLFLPAYLREKCFAVKTNSIEKLQMNEEDLRTIKLAEEDYLIDCDNEKIKITVMYSENLPMFSMNLVDDISFINSSKDNESSGLATIIESSGITTYTGDIRSVHGHGDTSWTQPKKSYAIKTDRAPLCGMNSSNEWILISNVYDKSFVKNKVVFDFYNRVQDLWSPDCRWVDLYVNGDYQGNYLLTEKIKIGDNRLQLSDLGKYNKQIFSDVNAIQIDYGDVTVRAYDYDTKKNEGGYIIERVAEETFLTEDTGFELKKQNVILQLRSLKEPL